MEDIHGLMSAAKRPPKPQQMAVYYARLTRVYWVSDNYLYHGYAWLRLLQLSRAYNKNLKARAQPAPRSRGGREECGRVAAGRRVALREAGGGCLKGRGGGQRWSHRTQEDATRGRGE